MQEHYFDHDADIGIIGRGKTIEEAFVSGAEALFGIMTNLKQVKASQCIKLEFEEDDIELAFTIWLNLLINQSNSHNLVFSKFSLTRTNNHWLGEAWGCPWTDDIERGTDVKGATLTMLSVKKVDQEWDARCVVDV